MARIKINAKAIASKFAGKEVTVITEYLQGGKCNWFKGILSNTTYTDDKGVEYLLVAPHGETSLKPYTVEYLINSGNDFSKINHVIS